MKKSLVLFSLLMTLNYVSAQLSLPHFFSDHMVLQRDTKNLIWGTAFPGKTITLTIGEQKISGKANKDGKWKLSINPLKAGGPYTLTIKSGKESRTISDIMVGEVWICSGQSNMEFRLSIANNSEQEIANANYPAIRTFNVDRYMSHIPQNNVKGNWRICKPELAADFSAVAYFFARELYQKLKVPIGIINSSWGGTDIETWMSMESIAGFTKYDKLLNRMKSPEFESYVKHSEDVKKEFDAAFEKEPGISEKWYATNYNITNWKKHQVPALWNSSDLNNMDGVTWFCYDFELPAECVGSEAKISLGPIDDDDITWMNGKQIGKTAGYDIKRNYDVPAGLVQTKNRISIKISDYRGGGGLYGPNENLYIQIGERRFSLVGEWKYKVSLSNEAYDFVEYGPNAYPSLLFNGMIHPLIGLSFRGVIWYQGENNAARASEYESLFPTMINDWRKKWNSEFPFYWVQLANFMQAVNEPNESHWANLRNAQSKTLKLSNTGQAVIIDIGDANDIHPRNKQDVGKRLAMIALHNDYKYTNIEYSGPTLKNAERIENNIVLSFDHIANGLVAKNKYDYLMGFTIAGEDGKYYWAQAKIEDNKVIVSSEKVNYPMHVRYAWADNPEDANLYNTANLPASPFEATVK